MDRSRHVRVVKALVLGALLPACGASTSDPSPSPVTDSALSSAPGNETGSTPGPVASAGDAAPKDASELDADVDSELPFSSGPLCPPEMPGGFASCVPA
jgi:hypothetical protein